MTTRFGEDHATSRADARGVPTLMLIPIVLFIFPSIIMVMMGPAVIQIVRTVMPMMSGL